MKLIPLTKGYHAIIDDADYEVVSRYTWCVRVCRTGTCYAEGYIPKTGKTKARTIRLHRFLLNAPDGISVDHINRNGLDNRRENIRLCDQSGNNANMVPVPNKTGFRGVFVTSHGTFASRVKWHGVKYYCGTFQTAEEAARARDIKALEIHGEFARLNFPVAA